MTTDGGSAFSRPAFYAPGTVEDGLYNGPETGMSLRDYFAAKAMQGWLASYGPNNGQPSPDTIAAMAYRFADGMIKARRHHDSHPQRQAVHRQKAQR